MGNSGVVVMKCKKQKNEKKNVKLSPHYFLGGGGGGATPALACCCRICPIRSPRDDPTCLPTSFPSLKNTNVGTSITPRDSLSAEAAVEESASKRAKDAYPAKLRARASTAGKTCTHGAAVDELTSSTASSPLGHFSRKASSSSFEEMSETWLDAFTPPAAESPQKSTPSPRSFSSSVVPSVLPEEPSGLVKLDGREHGDSQLAGGALAALAVGVERQELDVGAVAGGAGKRVLDVEAPLLRFRLEGFRLFLPDGLGLLAETRVADVRGMDLEDHEPVSGLVSFFLCIWTDLRLLFRSVLFRVFGFLMDERKSGQRRRTRTKKRTLTF